MLSQISLSQSLLESFTSNGAVSFIKNVAVATILLPTLLFIGWIALTYCQMLWQRRTLPPGPFPLPIVGNCLHLSNSKPWLQFKQWSRDNRNGLLTIWIGRTPTVICNDAWCASDLMDKRSNIDSSRPRYIVFGELTGESDTNQVLLPYNDKWRSQRRVMVGYNSLKVRLVVPADSLAAHGAWNAVFEAIQSFPSR
jgi:hypothetical protein